MKNEEQIKSKIEEYEKLIPTKENMLDRVILRAKINALEWILK